MGVYVFHNYTEPPPTDTILPATGQNLRNVFPQPLSVIRSSVAFSRARTLALPYDGAETQAIFGTF